jgi:hypothetical protein
MRRCSRSLIIYEGPLRPALRSWKVFWPLCSESKTRQKGGAPKWLGVSTFVVRDGGAGLVQAI